MTWLPGAHVVDLTGRSNGAGDGPFSPGQFYGVVLHCNGSTGADTPDQFFIDGGGPDSVCPNFQVHADGTIAQYLPLEWSPWCQADGNTNYAAIETAGGADPLTAAQLASVASIVRAYHDVLGMPLQLAEAPGQRGLGYHAMGGQAWGGHPCPLPARIAQRPQILQLAGSSTGDTPLSAAEVNQINKHTDDALAHLFDRLHTDFGGTMARVKTFATEGVPVSGASIDAFAQRNTAYTDILLSDTTSRIKDIQAKVAALHTSASGQPADMQVVLDAINALPAAVRADLVKHLGGAA